MKNNFYFFIVITILFAQIVFPQKLCRISGNVYDDSTKVPIPNANIIVRGTNSETTTDSLGHFSI